MNDAQKQFSNTVNLVPAHVPVGQTEKYLQKLGENKEDEVHEQNKHV